jgi:hypothetical protein
MISRLNKCRAWLGRWLGRQSDIRIIAVETANFLL